MAELPDSGCVCDANRILPQRAEFLAIGYRVVLQFGTQHPR